MVPSTGRNTTSNAELQSVLRETHSERCIMVGCAVQSSLILDGAEWIVSARKQRPKVGVLQIIDIRIQRVYWNRWGLYGDVSPRCYDKCCTNKRMRNKSKRRMNWGRLRDYWLLNRARVLQDYCMCSAASRMIWFTEACGYNAIILFAMLWTWCSILYLGAQKTCSSQQWRESHFQRRCMVVHDPANPRILLTVVSRKDVSDSASWFQRCQRTKWSVLFPKDTSTTWKLRM